MGNSDTTNKNNIVCRTAVNIIYLHITGYVRLVKFRNKLKTRFSVLIM